MEFSVAFCRLKRDRLTNSLGLLSAALSLIAQHCTAGRVNHLYRLQLKGFSREERTEVACSVVCVEVSIFFKKVFDFLQESLLTWIVP